MRKAKQDWAVGKSVKVGFLTFTVAAKVPTPGDHMPDVYNLMSAKGEQYSFRPHFGLERGWYLAESAS